MFYDSTEMKHLEWENPDTERRPAAATGRGERGRRSDG